MQPSKPWYASRTILANLVAIVIIILVQLQTIPTIPQAWVPWLVAAIPVANMILRLITTQPLALTAGPSEPLVYRLGVDTMTPPAGVSFDTGPSAKPGEHNYLQPEDVATLPTLPGKEEPHDGV